MPVKLPKLVNIIRWGWEAPQNLLGTAVFLANRKSSRKACLGKLVVFWEDETKAMSLSQFLFLPSWMAEEENLGENDLFVHEYGHTIQSAIFGPFYLIVIGLPSAIWANFPFFVKLRAERNIDYYDVWFEKTATILGRRFLLKGIERRN